jgi:hypothetical protein
LSDFSGIHFPLNLCALYAASGPSAAGAISPSDSLTLTDVRQFTPIDVAGDAVILRMI